MNTQEVSAKLVEQFAPSEILGPSQHLLDQPFFHQLRKDASTIKIQDFHDHEVDLLPQDIFLHPDKPDGWIVFVHLATGPNWGISNDPQAKDTLRNIRRENREIFNPKYGTDTIVTIGSYFHRYLKENHKYCIPYIQKYQRYFSWKKDPRHLPYTTTPIPTYEAFCRRMAEIAANVGV